MSSETPTPEEMTLDELREEIEAIDREIVELIARRTYVADTVAEVKSQRDLPTTDESQETRVMDRRRKRRAVRRRREPRESHLPAVDRVEQGRTKRKPVAHASWRRVVALADGFTNGYPQEIPAVTSSPS